MAYFLSTLALAVCIGSVHVILYTLYRMVKTAFFSKLLKIPGLAYGPLYGNVKESMVGEAMESSVKWVKRYGGIVRFYQLFGREQILIADPDAVRRVLVTNSTNYPRARTREIARLAAQGLFYLEGPTHRSERKLLNPSFNHSAIQSMMPIFNQTADKVTSKVDDLIGAESCSGRVNVQVLMKSATMDVIGLAAFEHDFNAIEDPTNEIVESLGYLLSAQRRSLLSGLPFYRLLPIKANFLYVRAEQIVNKMCYQMIKHRRENPSKERNILTTLLGARYDGGDVGLSDSALRDHAITFMVAGHETTSATLTWLLLELARNPEVEERLFGEIDSAERSADGAVSGETLDQLEYLEACIKESLRLYPAAPAIIRKAERDDVLGGYEIPGGTTVVVHFGAMMRTMAEDGELFRPDRFLSDQSGGVRWLPFSIGSHACIGNKFAMMEMKVLLAHLVQRFKFSTVANLTIHRKRALVLRPEPDVELIVAKRT